MKRLPAILHICATLVVILGVSGLISNGCVGIHCLVGDCWQQPDWLSRLISVPLSVFWISSSIALLRGRSLGWIVWTSYIASILFSVLFGLIVELSTMPYEFWTIALIMSGICILICILLGRYLLSDKARDFCSITTIPVKACVMMSAIFILLHIAERHSKEQEKMRIDAGDLQTETTQPESQAPGTSGRGAQ